MNREQYLKRFKEITDEMLSITTSKNNDYGGHTDPWKNFRTFGRKGILVRIGDKFSRLCTAIWEEREFKVKETLRDTILDLAVYCIILICWIEDETPPLEGESRAEFEHDRFGLQRPFNTK